MSALSLARIRIMAKPCALTLLLSLTREFSGERKSAVAYQLACEAVETLTENVRAPLDKCLRNAVANLFVLLVPPSVSQCEMLLDAQGAETGSWSIMSGEIICWVDAKGALVAQGKRVAPHAMDLLATSPILWVRSVLKQMAPWYCGARYFWRAVDAAAMRYHVALPSGPIATEVSVPSAIAPVRSILSAADPVSYCVHHGLVFSRLFVTNPGGMRDKRVTLQVMRKEDSVVVGHVVFYVDASGRLPDGTPVSKLLEWLYEKHPHCTQ